MTTSKSIAALIGPTLVAIAVAMLLNLGSFPALAQQASRDPALVILSGILSFVAGLAILRVHNIWTAGWPLLVTVLGWLAIIGGLIRLFFPFQLGAMATGLGQNTGVVIAIFLVFLLVGIFLSYKGWSR